MAERSVKRGPDLTGSRAARSIAAVKSFRRTLFVLYVAAMLVAFFVPVPAVPVSLPNQFDKMVHVGIFFGFALLLHFDRRPRPWITLLVSLAFAGVVELVQSLVPYRSGEWWDFVAGAAGAGLGVVLVVLFRRRSDSPDDSAPPSPLPQVE
jgi:VanZ family protein